jgi:hypothetical protein
LGDLKDNGRIMVEIWNRFYVILHYSIVAEENEGCGSGGDRDNND